ncbi:MAG: hypothetical protein ACPGN3_16535 [Opitutales bacterium]
MTRIPPSWLLILTAVSTSFAETQLDYVELLSADGRPIEAKIISQDGQTIRIERRDGQRFEVPLAQFSQESQSIITAQLEAASQPHGNGLVQADRLNEVFGIPLLSSTSFWQETESSLMGRIRWPLESETQSSSSYRIYPGSNYKILSRRPHSAVCYFGGGSPELISIVFANKGDSFNEAPSPREAERFIRDAIKADGDAIEQRLTAAFGEAKRQSYGEGRSTRQRIQRWDVSDIAILLSNIPGEYVGLQIVPTYVADNKGVSDRLSDSDVRQMAKGNVIERTNGDVVIDNIPMVNQGPKGYCAPATFERYLRYMGLTADMYLLALAGQTQIGGGTYMAPLLDGVRSMLSRNNRSLSEIRKMPDLRSIKKFIDEGRPVMWTLYSTRRFNDLSDNRSATRKQVSDWDEWDRHLRDYRKNAKSIPAQSNNAHIAMIIGYNDDTGEIAFSDSWGPDYSERWLTEEELLAFSQGFNYVVDF